MTSGIISEKEVELTSIAIIGQLLKISNDISNSKVKLNVCWEKFNVKTLVKDLREKTLTQLDLHEWDANLSSRNCRKPNVKFYIRRDVQELILAISKGSMCFGFNRVHKCEPHNKLLTDKHLFQCHLVNNDGRLKYYQQQVNKGLKNLSRSNALIVISYFGSLQMKIKRLEEQQVIANIK